MRQVSRLLKLTEEDLIQPNLKSHQKYLWDQFKDGYKATLLIVRSNFAKEFVFYIPYKFEE